MLPFDFIDRVQGGIYDRLSHKWEKTHPRALLYVTSLPSRIVTFGVGFAGFYIGYANSHLYGDPIYHISAVASNLIGRISDQLSTLYALRKDRIFIRIGQELLEEFEPKFTQVGKESPVSLGGETNPLLGPSPSKKRLLLFYVPDLLLTSAIALAYPPLGYGISTASLYAAANNIHVARETPEQYKRRRRNRLERSLQQFTGF